MMIKIEWMFRLWRFEIKYDVLKYGMRGWFMLGLYMSILIGYAVLICFGWFWEWFLGIFLKFERKKEIGFYKKFDFFGILIYFMVIFKKIQLENIWMFVKVGCYGLWVIVLWYKWNYVCFEMGWILKFKKF